MTETFPRRVCGVAAVLLVAILGPIASREHFPILAAERAQAPAAVASVENAKTWIGHHQDYENYLRSAAIVRTVDIGTGVTKPKRAYLAPGGPFESMSFKPLTPGMRQGYWESYKSEVAAYELDKLLQLDMVPPTIERKIDNLVGAVTQWVKPVRDWKSVENSTPSTVRWARQLVRMKMLDNLICNKDRNAGNILVDPGWNLILIDHSRAFIKNKDLPFELTRVDRELWARMEALTVESLTPAVGAWLTQDEIKAMLARRDKMQVAIEKLVKAKGAGEAYLPALPTGGDK